MNISIDLDDKKIKIQNGVQNNKLKCLNCTWIMEVSGKKSQNTFKIKMINELKIIFIEN